MKNPDEEQQYYRRLSERQIKRRDPQIKRRKVSSSVSDRYSRRKSETLGQMMGGLSHKVQGLGGGLILAMGLWIVLAMFFTASWVDIVGVLALVLFPLFGFVIGNAFDTRDKLRDF